MWGIWAWSFIRDELEFGAGLAREITDLAATLGDPGYRMEAHFAVGCNAFYRGEFLTSRKECELGLTLYTPERGRFHCGYTGQDSGVTNHCYSACSLWYQGYPDQALRRVARAVALGRELDHPFSHVFALYHDAFLKQQCRQGPQTVEAAEMLRRLAEEQGFPFWVALGILTRGTGLLLQGDCDGAIACLQDGLKALRATGAGIVVPHFTLWLAEAYGRAGRFDEAFSTLDEAESLAHACKELFNEAELHRTRGELLLARPGDDDPWPSPPRPRPASTVPSRPPAASVPARSSCGPPPASPACSGGSPAPIRPARSSPQCTSGSPRGSRPATWPMPGACSMN